MLSFVCFWLLLPALDLFGFAWLLTKYLSKAKIKPKAKTRMLQISFCLALLLLVLLPLLLLLRMLCFCFVFGCCLCFCFRFASFGLLWLGSALLCLIWVGWVCLNTLEHACITKWKPRANYRHTRCNLALLLHCFFFCFSFCACFAVACALFFFCFNLVPVSDSFCCVLR